MTRTPITNDPGPFFAACATVLAVLDASGAVQCANHAFRRAFATDGDLVGKPFCDLLRKDDRARATDELEAAVSGDPAPFDATPADGDGAKALRFEPTRLPSGEILLAAVPAPPRAHDDELRLTIFRRVLDSGPVGYFATDAKGIYTANEGKAGDRLGIHSGELIGKSCLEMWRDQPESYDNMRRTLAGEEVHTQSSVPGMDVEIWHIPIFDRDRAVRATVGFVIDLTSQRDAERQVREKLALIETQNATLGTLARVLETAPLVLWCADMSGVATMSEGRGLDLIGARPGEMVGMNLLELYREQSDIAGALVRALGGEESRQIVSPVPGVHFDSWYLPLRASDGVVQGVIGLAIDASERIQSERQLREKLDLIERQSATIRALATPIIQVWDEILCLPVIGTVDSARTADMMQALLEAIVREQARFAIVDLTGVEVVDTSTADHLIQLFRAARVLGVDGVLCGIRPAVAQTVVALGLELSSIKTMRSLRDALKWCIRARNDSRVGGGRPGALAATNGGAPAYKGDAT